MTLGAGWNAVSFWRRNRLCPPRPLAQQGVLGAGREHFLSSHCGPGQHAHFTDGRTRRQRSCPLCSAHVHPLFKPSWVWTRSTHLLNGADGDSSRTGHHDVPVLDVGTDLVQDEGDDVRLHGQEEHVAVLHCLLVAGGQVHPHLLRVCRGGLSLCPSLAGPPHPSPEPGASARNRTEAAGGVGMAGVGAPD